MESVLTLSLRKIRENERELGLGNISESALIVRLGKIREKEETGGRQTDRKRDKETERE